jgi:hypothetical protein
VDELELLRSDLYQLLRRWEEGVEKAREFEEDDFVDGVKSGVAACSGEMQKVLEKKRQGGRR